MLQDPCLEDSSTIQREESRHCSVWPGVDDRPISTWGYLTWDRRECNETVSDAKKNMSRNAPNNTYSGGSWKNWTLIKRPMAESNPESANCPNCHALNACILGDGAATPFCLLTCRVLRASSGRQKRQPCPTTVLLALFLQWCDLLLARSIWEWRQCSAIWLQEARDYSTTSVCIVHQLKLS